MKNFPLGKVALASLVPLLGWILLASAQDAWDNKNGTDAAKKGEAGAPAAARFAADSPDLRSTSAVSFKKDGKELRVVGISPQLKTSKNYVPGLRFHKILGAMAERDKPVEEGMPLIVDGVRRNPDGSVWLRFRVIVTTPNFQKQCRDAVLADERELLAKERLTQDDIRIEPWPLKHCVVSAQDSFSKEIVGVSQTGTLTGTKEEFSFTMQFSADELHRVIGLIRSGELEFVYSYSFVGSTEYAGSVDLKGVKNAKLIASQKLRSEQLEGKEPIFQAEANEAVRHLYVSVQKTMRASHKDLIPLLDPPNLFQKLFTEDGQITFKDLKEGDEKTALMLAAYLKPQLEQVRESLGGEQSGITIHQDRQTEQTGSSSTFGGSVGATLPLPVPISFGISGSDTDTSAKAKQVLDRVQQATGSRWAYDKATERFRPHSVKKLKFQAGADQVLIDEKTTVFLSVGAENRYLEETPIPVTFTTKTAEVKPSAARPGDLGPYEGVPIGAMVPFFGVKPPKGYVWADGQANFPDADWVPTHLRGAKVPDMRRQLLGGAEKEADVAQVWKNGKLSFTIAGSNFKLPEGTPVSQTAKTDAVIWVRGPQIPTIFKTPSDQPDAQIRIEDVTTSYLKYSGSVVGSQSVTLGLDKPEHNPRHVMCRWIIRVE